MTIMSREDKQEVSDDCSYLYVTVDDGRVISFPHSYKEASTEHNLSKFELAWFLERMRRKHLL